MSEEIKPDYDEYERLFGKEQPKESYYLLNKCWDCNIYIQIGDRCINCQKGY